MAHTLLVIDDHPLFRDALRLAIGPRLDAKVLEADGMEGGRAQLEGHADDEIDLVLLDLNLPDVQGLAGLASLRAGHADVPVAIVSGSEDPALIRRCMRLGAAGFIPKTLSADETVNAILTVLDGESWTPAAAQQTDFSEEDEIVTRLATLTPQQVRVLGMLAQGMLNKQIAYELTVSEATVKAHVSAILAKLDVDSRTQAVIQASKVDQAEWQGVHAA